MVRVKCEEVVEDNKSMSVDDLVRWNARGATPNKLCQGGTNTLEGEELITSGNWEGQPHAPQHSTSLAGAGGRDIKTKL